MDRLQLSIAEHVRTIEALAPLAPKIEAVATRMVQSLRGGGKVLWMGNGGSAADAQHLAAELMGRFERERRGWPSLALGVNTSVLTAVGNDYGYERVFARQVEALCGAQDVLVGISTSGTSPNVIAGLQAGRARGAFCVGLAGRDGGALPEHTDICLTVPAQRTARIQEAHILIGHLLCELVEVALAA
jgi:D-sedoheptulose 7-phosphate isomerase